MTMAWLAAASFVLSVLALISAETEAPAAATTTTTAPSDGPLVTVKQGTLRGHIITRQDNSKIYAFEGIPYAKPPVGELRFKDPQEAEPWSEVRSATSWGSHCVGVDIFNGTISGEEDCLFINVYTADAPEKWTNTKRPVVVWVHWGSLVMGSGDTDLLRPDPLLKKNFIYVSFNYRLGVLGFMNSEDSAAPGNAGLKDMVQALRWVKENIAQFGGDAEQVSLIGVSGGAAAVHYLTISPMASGLFLRALSLGGNALTPWAFKKNPRAAAEALRARLQCDETLDLIPCLQSVDAHVLVASNVQQPTDTNRVVYQFWRDYFLPSVEALGSSASPFLSQEPKLLVNDTTANSVPFMTGVTNAEGIMFLKYGGLKDDPSSWAKMDENFAETFREDMPESLRTEENIQRMRQFYLGDRSLTNALNDTETMRRFIQMLSDLQFGESMVRAAVGAVRRGAPVYLYHFSYDSPLTAIFKRTYFLASDIPGVAHGDDSPYIFDMSVPLTEADQAVKDRHITLISNFLKTGNPTPEGSNLPTWPLFTLDNESYAEIGEEMTFKNHILAERIAFWRNLTSTQQAISSES